MARIVSQNRGRGSPTYLKKNASKKYTVKYNSLNNGLKLLVRKIIHDTARSAPICLLESKLGVSYGLGVKGMYEGQEVEVGENGSICEIGSLPLGTIVCNLENKPKDGGKLFRAAGCFGQIVQKSEKSVTIKVNTRRITFSAKCCCTVGVPGNANRAIRPLLKAGNAYYKYKAKSQKYPIVSKVAMNHHDHKFGSSGPKKPGGPRHCGRNYSPGQKVGSIAPRRQGYEN